MLSESFRNPTCKWVLILLLFSQIAQAQKMNVADSLRQEGLLMPALLQYGELLQHTPTSDLVYKVAETAALLFTKEMRDTAFYFLELALTQDSTLHVLSDPDFLSLIDDERWTEIENNQIEKYEMKNGVIQNSVFAKELFRMIIRDQGFMYAGNIERKKYLDNGGYFDRPAIFPILAQEEKYKLENEKKVVLLIEKYGWPTTRKVTETAAAGAALIINHSNYELRKKYFPLLEAAFRKGEAQPLRYAKMKDRLLVEEGKAQLYGTQIQLDHLKKTVCEIQQPSLVDQRRRSIGLGPLKPYLKSRFNIDWDVPQE